MSLSPQKRRLVDTKISCPFSNPAQSAMTQALEPTVSPYNEGVTPFSTTTNGEWDTVYTPTHEGYDEDDDLFDDPSPRYYMPHPTPMSPMSPTSPMGPVGYHMGPMGHHSLGQKSCRQLAENKQPMVA